MSDIIDQEIRILRAIFWSDRDPEGRAFVPLADAYLRKGDAHEALSLLEDGLARHPTFASAHLVSARAHRARGDASRVRQAVARTLELDPGNAAALRMQGEMAEADGDLPLALDSFREAFRRNPGWTDLEDRIERIAPEAEAMRPAAEPGQAPEPEGWGEATPVEAEERPGREGDALPEVSEDPLALDGAFHLDPTGSGEEGEAPAPLGDGLAALEDAPASGAPGDSVASLDDFGEIDLSTGPGGEGGDEDAGEEVAFDALAFEVSGIDELEMESERERERAGDLEAHARMLEGYAEGPPPTVEAGQAGEEAIPPAEEGDDFMDPFGFGGAPPARKEPPAPREEMPPVDAPAAAFTSSVEGEADDGEGPALVTRTLGELYARQGLVGRAVEVFEALVARDPADPVLAARLHELRARLEGEEEPGSGESAGVGSGTFEPGAFEPGAPEPEAVEPEALEPAAVDAGPAAADADRQAEAPPVEAPPVEAPQLEVPPIEEPQAQAPRVEPPVVPSPEELAERIASRPVGEHFADLLAWEPGAIPVEALAPGAVPIDALAPGAVPIDALAPGEHAGPPAPLDAEAFQRWLRERVR